MHQTSLSKLLIECWLIINLLMVPLAYASPEESQTVTSISDDSFSLGSFGRITTFSQEVLSQPEQPEKQSFKLPPSKVLIVPYLMVVLSMLSFVHRMNVKAQITIFMLLGLIVIGSFAWLFHMSKKLHETQLDTKVDSAVDELLQVTSVEEFITQCVDQVAKEGLKILGRQGGVFYPSQLGQDINFTDTTLFTLGADTFNVTYLGLSVEHPLVRAVIPIIDTVPWYPCSSPNNHSLTNPCFYRHNSPLTHPPWWNWLPELNTIYPLARMDTVLRYNLPNLSRWRYENMDPPKVSVQRQMENYLEVRVRDCANFSRFAQMLDYNIIDAPLNATVIMGVEDVSIEIVYPIVITVAGGEPIVRFLKFYANHPVRFRRIYSTVANLLYDESTDPFHNISLVFQLELGGEAMRITPHLNVLSPPPAPRYATSDVFVIEDLNEDHFLDGKPYTFIFAKRNRPPALDYIGVGTRETEPVPPESQGGIRRFDYIIANGTNLILRPFALDVDEGDEDLLRFWYSGWKQDYDDNFDWPNFWNNNCTYYPENCTYNNYSVVPRIWNNSYYHTISPPFANYTTGWGDIGSHVVRVWVSDGEFEDYQDIRILVVDSPRAYAVGSNPYADVENYYASIEDPYRLDASASTSMFCHDIRYLWFDDLEHTVFGQGILHNTTDVYVDIPYVFDITRVNGIQYPFENVSDHLVELELHHSCGQSINNAPLPVTVLECLPHRGYAAPYPYHNITVGPYIGVNDTEYLFANHTCCDNATGFYGNVTGTPTCFEYTNFTCRYDDPFNIQDWNNELESIWPGTSPPSLHNISITYLPIWPLPSLDMDNDVFFRNLTVECDGVRGNICNGTGRDDWSSHTVCTQCQFCYPGEENCRNYASDVFCDPLIRCYPTAGTNVSWTATGTYLARQACNGLGDCTGVYGAWGPNYRNYYVNDSGLRTPHLSQLFLSVNCDFYDTYVYQWANDPLTGAEIPDPLSLGRRDNTRFCFGECNTFNDIGCGGSNCCTTSDYSCGANTCIGSFNVDLDDNQLSCEACGTVPSFDYPGPNTYPIGQGTRWVTNGEAVIIGGYGGPGLIGCCGDDNGEYTTNCTANNGAGCNGVAWMCCDDSTSCTNEDGGIYECYDQGQYLDTSDLLQDEEFCYAGEWYDLDSDRIRCEGMYDWDLDDDWDTTPGEGNYDEADTHAAAGAMGMCCGDDQPNGEGNLVIDCLDGGDAVVCTSPLTPNSCCNVTSDCVAVNRISGNVQCYDTGEIHYSVSLDQYEYCGSNNLWVDPDGDPANCDPNGWNLPDDPLTPREGSCCGDDDTEFLKEDLFISGVWGCCDNALDCFTDHICINDGGTYTNASGSSFECENGHLLEPDQALSACEPTFGFWMTTGERNAMIPFGGYGQSNDCEINVGTACYWPCDSSPASYDCIECCGDDNGEEVTYQSCDATPNAYSCDGSVAGVCCNQQNDCVLDGICYSEYGFNPYSGGSHSVESHLTCSNSMWFDCDASAQACAWCDETDVNGGDDRLPDCNSNPNGPSSQCFVPTGIAPSSIVPTPPHVVQEFDDASNFECCGDDPGEVWSNNNGFLLCCPSGATCGWTNGVNNYCSFRDDGVESGNEALYGSCSDGVDNDCDNDYDCDDTDCDGSYTPGGVQCCNPSNVCDFDMVCSGNECDCDLDPTRPPSNLPTSLYDTFDYTSGGGSVSTFCSWSSFGAYDHWLHLQFNPGSTYDIDVVFSQYGSACSNAEIRHGPTGAYVTVPVPTNTFSHSVSGFPNYYIGFQSGNDCLVDVTVTMV